MELEIIQLHTWHNNVLICWSVYKESLVSFSEYRAKQLDNSISARCYIPLGETCKLSFWINDPDHVGGVASHSFSLVSFPEGSRKNEFWMNMVWMEIKHSLPSALAKRACIINTVSLIFGDQLLSIVTVNGHSSGFIDSLFESETWWDGNFRGFMNKTTFLASSPPVRMESLASPTWPRPSCFTQGVSAGCLQPSISLRAPSMSPSSPSTNKAARWSLAPGRMIAPRSTWSPLRTQ